MRPSIRRSVALAAPDEPGRKAWFVRALSAEKVIIRSEKEGRTVSDWFLVFSCGLAVGVGFWWLRRRAAVAVAADSDDAASERRRHPYHCVAIKRGSSSCAAANDLEGRRFLPAEAPLLPLPTCNTVAACRCRYARFDDRRDDERRRPHAMGRGFVDATGGMERRAASDRRRTAEFA